LEGGDIALEGAVIVAEIAFLIQPVTRARGLAIQEAFEGHVGAPNDASPSKIAQCQLVERAAAVVVAGGAPLAAVDGYSDKFVPVEHHTVIGISTVVIGSGRWIRCTEGMQNLEAAIFTQGENYVVAVRAP
jgi:hypothetical protein